MNVELSRRKLKIALVSEWLNNSVKIDLLLLVSDRPCMPTYRLSFIWIDLSALIIKGTTTPKNTCVLLKSIESTTYSRQKDTKPMMNGFKRETFKSQSCNDIKNTSDAHKLTPIIMGEILSKPEITNTTRPTKMEAETTLMSMTFNSVVSDDNTVFLYNILNEIATTAYPMTVNTMLSVDEFGKMSHINTSAVYALNPLRYNPRYITERRFTESKCVAKYTMAIAAISTPVDTAFPVLTSEVNDMTLPRRSLCVTNKNMPASTTSTDTIDTLDAALNVLLPYDKLPDKSIHGSATSTGNVPSISSKTPLLVLLFPSPAFNGSVLLTKGFLIPSLLTSIPAPNRSWYP